MPDLSRSEIVIMCTWVGDINIIFVMLYNLTAKNRIFKKNSIFLYLIFVILHEWDKGRYYISTHTLNTKGTKNSLM